MNGCSRQDRTLTSRTAAAPSSSRRAILLSAESRSVECFIRPPISTYRHYESRAGLNHGSDAEGGATDLLSIGIAESAIASGPLVSDVWRRTRPLWSCLRNVRQPFAPLLLAIFGGSAAVKPLSQASIFRCSRRSWERLKSGHKADRPHRPFCINAPPQFWFT